MKYRHMGKTGLRVSEISLGAWLTYGSSVESENAEQIIKAAIEKGVNFIDIADAYAKGEAEKVVGKAIKEFRRSDLVISSKLYWPMSDDINDRGLSRKHIMESIERSLKRIGTDYLDMYFCHRFDPDTAIEETVRAMSDLVQQGKVLYWGTSVWEAEKIERAVAESKRWLAYQPRIEQPRYNMLDRHIEERIMPTCAEHGIGLVVWSPLAQGILTGKYNNGNPAGSRAATTQWLDKHLTQENVDKVKKLTKLAKAAGIKMGQLALAWVLRREEITSAIIGATRQEQLEENVMACEVELSDDMLTAIDEILGEPPVTKFQF